MTEENMIDDGTPRMAYHVVAVCAQYPINGLDSEAPMMFYCRDAMVYVSWCPRD